MLFDIVKYMVTLSSLCCIERVL